ncbi:excisionase family DNA-binding protein [Microbacterium sp. ARD32]|uniref:helix-turn-helix transcriptional regulator n=1 Tax=Microbacterium sp. ARD32 TaxID=2962577 RepID=UPI002882B323|nr:excisionase family DNA-binding protein [Microbacterium sp. ARD32]MDT0157248.1 excisionase family DNA-binding protein [Microbacterium sp. ARD32]
MSTPTSSFITIQQAADALAVSTKTIRRRIADGTIPAKRIGSQIVRIPANALDGIGRDLAVSRRA